MLTDSLLFNLLDADTATLVLAANVGGLDIGIDYIGDKVTADGHRPMAPVRVATVHLGPRGTAKHPIDRGDPAFSGGYGAVRAVALGGGELFYAYLSVRGPSDSNPISGPSFAGTCYRVPYVPPPPGRSQRIRIACTNAGARPQQVTFENLAPATASYSIALPPLSTVEFDSAAERFDVAGNGAIEVRSEEPCAISALISRAGKDYHVYPAAFSE